MDAVLSCIYTFIGSAAFSFIFNIRGKQVAVAALGGLVSWIAYLICMQCINAEFVRYFIAAVVVSIYAEAMARVTKSPATIYLVIGILPLVPGAYAYYAMKALIDGSMTAFAENGILMLIISGGIAVGVFLVSSVVKLITSKINKKRIKKFNRAV